jgi:hypothetical protein
MPMQRDILKTLTGALEAFTSAASNQTPPIGHRAQRALFR